MAKKRSDVDDDFSLYEIEPDELDKALADLPSGESMITVYRVRPQGLGRPIFVATYTPEDFSLELIQENHGGGKYNLVAKRGHEVIKKIRVEIEGEPKSGTAPGNAYLRRVMPDGKSVFLSKKEQAEREEQERQERLAKSGVDPIILLLIQEIRSLKESIGAGNNNGFDRKAFLEEMLTFKTLFSSNPVGDQTNMISSILQKGLEIGAKAANGEVGSVSWVDTIRELIPVAQQALTAFANKAAIEQARVIQPMRQPENKPLPTNTIGDILPAMSNEQPQASGFAAVSPMLQAFMPFFIGLAARNGDPNSALEMVDANISEEHKPHIIEWLSSPAWFKDLVSIDPRIQLQAAWWTELHDMLLAELTGTELPDDNPPAEENLE